MKENSIEAFELWYDVRISSLLEKTVKLSGRIGRGKGCSYIKFLWSQGNETMNDVMRQ